MEKGRTFETVVGVITLVIALFFFNYVYQKSGWQHDNGFVLTARFDKADGLVEGVDVKLSGVRIGKISSVVVDPSSFMAIVTFSIPKEIKLPKDTGASVASDGLFGGKYLSLSPGGEEDLLKSGDVIENTSGPLNLESLIGKFMFSKDKDESKDKANK